MELDASFDPQALADLTSDLQQLKMELILDCGGVEHLDDVEQELIDSIDNLLEEIDIFNCLDKNRTDPALIRRKCLKIEALILFVNEAIDQGFETESDDIEFDDEDDSL